MWTAFLLAALGFVQDPPVVGTWKLTDKLKTNGPREVVIRADSSASWGEEHARWRLVEQGRVIMIAVGGEWETYDIRVRGNRLTLSGGDLTDPITLTRIGPPTPRPPGVPVPPDPDRVPPRR
jgi:hypothetical protein